MRNRGPVLVLPGIFFADRLEGRYDPSGPDRPGRPDGAGPDRADPIRKERNEKIDRARVPEFPESFGRCPPHWWYRIFQRIAERYEGLIAPTVSERAGGILPHVRARIVEGSGEGSGCSRAAGSPEETPELRSRVNCEGSFCLFAPLLSRKALRRSDQSVGSSMRDPTQEYSSYS
jgi:hypothetical protein